jgi:hypothetical protein
MISEAMDVSIQVLRLNRPPHIDPLVEKGYVDQSCATHNAFHFMTAP